ncbi:Fc.00g113780.m01.CDS01 [Cosmosporella sp. VM-42]
MATPSIAVQPQSDGGSAPALLDRARGLTTGISAAATAVLRKDGENSTEGSVVGDEDENGEENEDYRDLDNPHGENDEARMRKRGSGGSLPTGASTWPQAASELSPFSTKPSHRYTHSGRITKNRQHHATPTKTTTPAPKPTPTRTAVSIKIGTEEELESRATATTGSMATATALNTSPSSSSNTTTVSSNSVSNLTTATIPIPEMEPPVLSFWGPDPVPLPSRFARIKRNLIRGHETELEASWTRLLHALRAEVDHMECLGAHLIPSIEFADIEDPAQTARFGHDLRRYGVGVIRKVMPKPDADSIMRETVQYLDSKRHIKAFQQQDPTCFDYFWTPAQVRSRAHPGVLCAQRFMMGLWDTSPDDRLVTRLPITYVDRIRVHGAGEHRPNGLSVPPIEPPQSADDWINSLQSSAGIIAQVDNGSLERWEPDGYQQAGTYNHVFHGRWEDHDPWECASRVSASMDLYNGYGACTIFRMFQGVLALSTIEPGMIRLLPSPKLATAYYLLRPFFSSQSPPPESRCGPEWEAYLAPENWRLERDPDTIIHGAVPGHAQRITEHWHPHLHLRGSMVTLPTLQPGDYIFWHPDLPYHISSNNPGLRTPSSNEDDTSMLVYIPAAPLTQTNALYLARQRKAFQRGHPGPDFDSTGRGTVVEDAETRPGEKEIAEIGGPAGLQAMGLAPWEVAGTRGGTPPSDRTKAKSEDVDMEAEVETKSLLSVSSTSHAEAEVVRLANIILFPDRSMMGCSV